jgi:hypothetical protein
MSAKRKRQEAFKAKEKKQKIIAGVGGVLLLGLLAFQVPRVMKMMHPAGAPAAVAAATTTTSATPSSTEPTDGSSSSGGAGLIASSGGATEGQLTSFSRFESKDPFQQQVDESTTAASASAPASASASSGGGKTGSSPSGGSGPTAPSGGGTQPAPGGAVISVNGTLMTVATGSNFPESSPLFHLISVTSTTAKISIAGGSYSSGAASVTLHLNKPVTLMNTADGTRYKLILEPQGTPVPGASASTGTSTTSTTPTTPSP